MATSENVREEFDDLGFTLDDPQIVDRLVSMKELIISSTFSTLVCHKEIWNVCLQPRILTVPISYLGSLV